MKTRIALLLLLGGIAGAPLPAQSPPITIPAVASIVGAAPFFSDVRIFNTSYGSPVEVTAVYRCFLGSCPAFPAVATFVLAPRESRAFDDIVVSTFNAPNSAGGARSIRCRDRPTASS